MSLFDAATMRRLASHWTRRSVSWAPGTPAKAQAPGSQAAAVPGVSASLSSSGADLRALRREAQRRTPQDRSIWSLRHPCIRSLHYHDLCVSRSPALPGLCVQDALWETGRGDL